MPDGEQEMVLSDDVGEKGVDGLPLPSLDAKFFICGKEFERIFPRTLHYVL